MHLGIVSATVFLFNLPFGYWRAHVTKLSLQWFLAVHLPVVVAIALRLLMGLGWQLITFPVLIGAYCSGQLLGGGYTVSGKNGERHRLLHASFVISGKSYTRMALALFDFDGTISFKDSFVISSLTPLVAEDSSSAPSF